MEDHGVGPSPEQARIMAALREELVPGGPLPAERKLAEKLGVKRHQLRIALRYLREEGSAPAPRPRNRTKVAPPQAQEMVRNTNPVEVLELRMMIEPPLARLAALRATPNMIAEMQRIADQIAEGGRRYNAGDLHRAIAQASGNTLAYELYDLLRSIERDVRLSANVASGLTPPADAAEHRAIIEAIAARDPELAERMMRGHLASIHALMTLGR